jgi:hypothetical protein
MTRHLRQAVIDRIIPLDLKLSEPLMSPGANISLLEGHSSAE